VMGTQKRDKPQFCRTVAASTHRRHYRAALCARYGIHVTAKVECRSGRFCSRGRE
jgi:hypothetical protein